MTNIMIATPCYNGVVTKEYTVSMLKLQNLLIKEGLQFAVLMPQASLITVARNFAVAEFLKNQAFTHLAFIDADVGFEPGVVRQYLQIEKDIVAGHISRQAGRGARHPVAWAERAHWSGLSLCREAPRGRATRDRWVC